ncbi:MAG: hypothetical protein LIO69_02735 [Oscillospiraceae bacterium]|nr:hypothetical protein [Oscillospiraceae bacterium]
MEINERNVQTVKDILAVLEKNGRTLRDTAEIFGYIERILPSITGVNAESAAEILDCCLVAKER